LSQEKSSLSPTSWPSRIALIAVYLFCAAVVTRTLALTIIRPRLSIYLGLEFLYLLLFTLLLWRPGRSPVWHHLYFVFQSMLILYLLSLRPKFDFLTVLFELLSFQVGLVFRGRVRWMWVAILVLLTGLPLTVILGVYGLAVALLPMAVCIVFPAYVIVMQEITAGWHESQALVDELQAANQHLTSYASQVEELSTIQERNRLARELHDSVSQTIFSVSLQTRAARILLDRDPEHLQPQLEQLQALTQSALAEMRGLIAQLRPQEKGPSDRPTS
jgi:signal transduction histidine kinase